MHPRASPGACFVRKTGTHPDHSAEAGISGHWMLAAVENAHSRAPARIKTVMARPMNNHGSTTPGHPPIPQACQTRRIRRPSKMGIDNPVADLGDQKSGRPCPCGPPFARNAGLCKCPRDGALGSHTKAETGRLDRQREAAESLEHIC